MREVEGNKIVRIEQIIFLRILFAILPVNLFIFYRNINIEKEFSKKLRMEVMLSIEICVCLIIFILLIILIMWYVCGLNATIIVLCVVSLILNLMAYIIMTDCYFYAIQDPEKIEIINNWLLKVSRHNWDELEMVKIMVEYAKSIELNFRDLSDKQIDNLKRCGNPEILKSMMDNIKRLIINFRKDQETLFTFTFLVICMLNAA